MTWAEITRPYPFPVAPYELETFESFSRRVLAENFEQERHKTVLTNAAAPFFPGMRRPRQWKELLLAKTGVARERFEGGPPAELRHHDGTTCQGCRTGTGDQWMCRECSHGEAIELQPHLERLVCLEHRIWIGSGTQLENQFVVENEFIDAEQAFQKLRRLGRADAATLWEIIHIVDPSLVDEAEHHLMPSRPFPKAMALWSHLADDAFQRKFFDPNSTYAEALGFLRSALAVLPWVDDEMCKRVWHYLRPTALAVREWLLSGGEFAIHWEHDFYISPSITAAWTRPMRPLEPFNRYLAASGVSEITPLNWREVVTHRSAGHSTKFVRQRPNGKLSGICMNGHRIHLYAYVKVGERSNFVCNCCIGRVAVAGDNDITSTHPYRATYFDETANPGVKATDLVAGSGRRINWRCPSGHPFPRQVSAQMRVEVACPKCEELRFEAEESSLAAGAPAAASEWHPTKNRCKPNQVYAKNTKELFWFQCENGHDYESTAYRRLGGLGCTQCPKKGRAESRKPLLYESRPDLKAEWDPELNDGLLFEEVRRTVNVVYKWRCRNGHISEKTPHKRVFKGCKRCRGRLRSGKSVADNYPLIVSEWDETRNPQTPSDHIDLKEKHWWRCKKASHIRFATIWTRRVTRGCPECPKEDRIAYGLEKGTF
ncbi:zinc-ribbon domain-containing protein [Diaminobutyricibacter tongyongensis]|uniref:Zinc-ribbon domain-containing protein n=1 Tax=Leifsonia tongyongensis TaxID=1268043 RepID=A0A6L9Y3D4_9MICO|nr:zinc-ribbon domain-containing protein [Diaminobutyricibacter tongyongensis]NEN07754.1 zinc-ribbon domain-containing protein [Diaminobutyricibacter tongyongensis]